MVHNLYLELGELGPNATATLMQKLFLQMSRREIEKIFFKSYFAPVLLHNWESELSAREEGRAELGVEGNEEEGLGGSCFSLPADVSGIARWHLNVLQKDSSLSLQLSHGVSFICIPRSGLKLSLAVGVRRALYLQRPRGPFVGCCYLKWLW